MSETELLEDFTVNYPKTVTKCHVEILRLERRIVELEAQNVKLSNDLRSVTEKFDEIESEEETRDNGAYDAIHSFLDECERTGPRRYDVPQSDRVTRAIITLHDVVGRNA